MDAGRCEAKLWQDLPQFQMLTLECLLNKPERVDAAPQVNPSAKTQREAKS